MTDHHEAEMDALAAQRETAGLPHILTRPDGGSDSQLTDRGAQVARQLAMTDEAGQDALLDALLGPED